LTAGIGIVVIGRNEGQRLRASVASATRAGLPVVYVDSGSTDDSLAIARAAGVDTLPLDPSRPFTAGRGRNEGLRRLLEREPDVELVQFIDGDCELHPAWIEKGVAALSATPHAAAVCGRVRERFPHASIYNRLCDLEWDQPPGEIDSCGGNALWRARLFLKAGGFDPTLIAGEEADLCLRVRASGWSVLRVGAEMVLHDAAMTRFAEWWRRAFRVGYAYTEGWYRTARSPERLWTRETRSALFWGVFVPSAAFILLLPTSGWSLLALAGYLALALRVRRQVSRRGLSPGDANLYAAFCVLAKFPAALGLLQFVALRLARRTRRVVDWRAVPRAQGSSVDSAPRLHDLGER
jgi:GT2 family glycosyltransferase